MHFLELKNIGKIYTSKGIVTVGIRGVNLEFDLGEVVAITGESGSGKTTLLNVIGGIDSYEEGEMAIYNETTSHFSNEEWEKYRDSYISFIFQDYKIIDSFTVLENVELSLLHIQSFSERRKRAIKLIKQVGLYSHINHKGSQLSGGQKQRTAIARALAKDCPIILADEPTGNLDEESSKEIISLLKEVSKNKLLIIVTHNFEQLKDYATREIRVYNGKIESDTVIKSYDAVEINSCPEKINNFRIGINSFFWGWKVFKAKPKLSLFLCFILILSCVGLFLFSSIVGKEFLYNISNDYHMFRGDNRVVVIKRDGGEITTEEIQRLVNTYDAQKYVRCDVLFDMVEKREWRAYFNEPEIFTEMYNKEQLPFWVDICDNIGDLDAGHYPETVSECVIYVPYALADEFKKDSINGTTIIQNGIKYDIVGVKYFTDNNQMGKVLLTDEGYRINSAMAYIGSFISADIEIKMFDGQTYSDEKPVCLTYSFDVPLENVYIKLQSLSEPLLQINEDVEYKVVLSRHDKIDDSSDKNISNSEYFYAVPKELISYDKSVSEDGTAVVVNPYTFLDLYESYIEENYSQCSLLFETKEKMDKAINNFKELDYLAISSDAEYIPSEEFFSEYFFSALLLLFVWMIAVFFLMLFVSLCTRRVLETFRNDMGVMRSIGIKENEIKSIVFIRIIIAVFPAIICTAALSFFSYRNVFLNQLIMYLYPVHYVMIFLGIMVVAIGVSMRHIRALFKVTVGNVLKGDE